MSADLAFWIIALGAVLLTFAVLTWAIQTAERHYPRFGRWLDSWMPEQEAWRRWD